MSFGKILLIAKPWRGGLAEYVYKAFEELFPGKVEWIPTRPVSLAEKYRYRKNKNQWDKLLVEKLAAKKRDLAFFINHMPSFSQLDYHPGNILWLTDGPNPSSGDYDPYAKVFLSDPGYLENVARVLPEGRLGGELAFGFLPEIHCWNRLRSEKKALCFIGNKDPKRDAYIKQILESGASLSVFGNYFLRHPLFWRYPGRFSPSIAKEKMGEVYADHKLALNLHADVVRQGTNMRTFECAAYGIPQLVEYSPGLEVFFDTDREIATFSGFGELQDKLSWLLADSESRLKMAAAAKQRALAEHSYQFRLQQMIERLG